MCRGRQQLCPQPAHAGVGLKGVRPALGVLVHHLQQVADGGRRLWAWGLTKTAWRGGRDQVGLLWLLQAQSSPVIRICGRPWLMWPRGFAICWAAQPSPPSRSRLTGGFLPESTFQQLLFRKEIKRVIICLAQLQLTWILVWIFVQGSFQNLRKLWASKLLKWLLIWCLRLRFSNHSNGVANTYLF